MSLPTFLVAGAARSGTTALHYYLPQHPEIAMSAIKEPNHFVFRPGPGGPQPLIGPERRILVKSVPDRGEYERLFRPAAGERAVGEASPLYLYVRETPALVVEAIPGVRAIALLREPVSRAWSHFLHIYRGPADEAVDAFRRAVEEEMEHGPAYTPYRTGTHYLRLGRYAEQVQRWRDTVGADRLHVELYEDFDADTPEALRRMCSFLGVDPEHRFDTSVIYNRSGLAGDGGTSLLRRTLSTVQPYAKRILPTRLVAAVGRTRAQRAASGLERPAVPDELAARLRDWFADDEAELTDLLGRDLTAWGR